MKKTISLILAVMLCSAPVGINAVAEQKDTVPPKDKISNSLYQEFTELEQSGVNMQTEKIPVWIWYQDIDQKQVDKQVEKQTGLTEDNIAVDFEMPGITLLSNLQNEIPDSQENMKAYLERTAVVRELEKQKTELYISKRRDISRNKYDNMSSDLLNKIQAGNIRFKSNYAPAIIVEMSKKEVAAAAQLKEIERIALYTERDFIDDDLSSVNKSTGAEKVRNTTGLTGKGVKVGQIENGVPGTHTELNPEKIHTVDSTGKTFHATSVARIMGGSSGIAPGIEIYAGSASTSMRAIEEMIRLGVSLVNRSNGANRTDSYTDLERWYDHLASQHHVTFVQAAGNDSVATALIHEPGLAYNVITVSAYEDKATETTEDDRIATYSRYLKGGGCLKPDIAGPVANQPINGTSAATPAVTGVIALLFELKPSLVYQPQTVKAILTASVQRKVICDPVEEMEQGLTTKQGAGAVDAWNAISIISQHQYGYGEITSDTEYRNFVQMSYGASHINIGLSWLRENIASGDHSSSTEVEVQTGVLPDLDMRVYNSDGSQAGASINYNSSTEMAYFSLPAGSSRYQIRINNYNASNNEPVRFAYAWGTDKMTFKKSLTGTDFPADGVYFLRSKLKQGSGAYLTVNETTGQVTQEAFTGASNQQWIIDKNGSEPFTVKTCSVACSGYLSRGSDNQSAVIQKNIPSYIAFGGNGLDNALSLSYYGTDNSITPSDSALGSGCVWRYISPPERFQWYPEPLSYQKGDVSYDGTIETADLLLMQKYIGMQITLTALQLYLADMNGDGVVNTADVLALQRLINSGA